MKMSLPSRKVLSTLAWGGGATKYHLGGSLLVKLFVSSCDDWDSSETQLLLSSPMHLKVSPVSSLPT